MDEKLLRILLHAIRFAFVMALCLGVFGLLSVISFTIGLYGFGDVFVSITRVCLSLLSMDFFYILYIGLRLAHNYRKENQK